MTAVRFEPYGEQYVLRFAYDPTLVSIVKTVPSYARSWQPTSRVWLIDRFYAEQLAADIARMGHTVIGLDAEPTPPPKASGDGDWARAVFKRVGPGRTDIVYKMLCKALHPDVGGDTQLMQELNEARREIT